MAHIRPCTRRHVYAAVYVSCVRPVCTARTRPCTRPRVRTMYTAEDVRADGPYTVIYTGGVDGPCARRARAIHGRVRAVYTAWPLYGRVRAVCAGEDVFTGRVHGRRVTGTRHVTRPCTRSRRPLTARTRPCNCRVDLPCTPYTWRCNDCVHVSRAQGRVHGRGRAV